MSMTSDETLAVTEVSQVGQARRAAIRLAIASKLSTEAQGEVAVIATELANNLARYGRDGRLFIQSMRRPEESFVQMLAVDSGAGYGGSAAQHAGRRVDRRHPRHRPRSGPAHVRRLRHLFPGRPGHAGPVPGQRSRPQAAAAGVSLGGDLDAGAARDRVRRRAGASSRRAANWASWLSTGSGTVCSRPRLRNRAAELFDAEAGPSEPARFCDRAHQALVGSRGAALAVAHVSTAGRVRYAGVGNIAGAIVGGDRQPRSAEPERHGRPPGPAGAGIRLRAPRARRAGDAFRRPHEPMVAGRVSGTRSPVTRRSSPASFTATVSGDETMPRSSSSSESRSRQTP